MTNISTRNGDALSAYAYGCMQFGSGADEAASRAMYDACRAAGINHFDTAYVYSAGASETLLGKFAASERDALYIATKVASEGGSGRANILEQFDVSRRRLGMDAVDLLYIHIFDPNTELGETFEILAEFQEQGLIRHIGVSNYSAWQVMKAQWVASEFGTRIDAVQPMYNLLKRQVEVEILPMAQDQAICVYPYSPLAGGLLSGKYATNPGDGRLTWDKRYQERYAPNWMTDAAAALSDLAAELGASPVELAVAWVAANPAITSPLISARTPEQLAPSLSAADIHMTPELYARLSALTPTPPPATDRTESM